MDPDAARTAPPDGPAALPAAASSASASPAPANGTTLSRMTGPDGNATLHLGHAAARATVVLANATLTRQVIVPAGSQVTLRLRPGDAPTGHAGLDPSALRWLWAFAAA